MREQIERLESAHKFQPTGALLDELEEVKSQLKLMELHQIAKDIMFSRQRTFEHRDKPGKCLSRLLAEVGDENIGTHMRKGLQCVL